MKRTLLLTLVVCAAGALGCADRLILQTSTFRTPEARRVQRVAVVDFAGEYGQAIADVVTINLLRAGYDVVERDQLSDIIKEAIVGKEDFMDLSDEEKARIFGKILNADVIMTGEVVRRVRPYYEKKGSKLVYESATLELAARAFDARTGKVFWTAVVNGTATATNGEQLQLMDYVNEPCKELVASLKNPDYQDASRIYEGREISELRRQRGF